MIIILVVMTVFVLPWIIAQCHFKPCCCNCRNFYQQRYASRSFGWQRFDRQRFDHRRSDLGVLIVGVLTVGVSLMAALFHPLDAFWQYWVIQTVIIMKHFSIIFTAYCLSFNTRMLFGLWLPDTVHIYIQIRPYLCVKTFMSFGIATSLFSGGSSPV